MEQCLHHFPSKNYHSVIRQVMSKITYNQLIAQNSSNQKENTALPVFTNYYYTSTDAIKTKSCTLKQSSSIEKILQNNNFRKHKILAKNSNDSTKSSNLN